MRNPKHPPPTKDYMQRAQKPHGIGSHLTQHSRPRCKISVPLSPPPKPPASFLQALPYIASSLSNIGSYCKRRHFFPPLVFVNTHFPGLPRQVHQLHWIPSARRGVGGSRHTGRVGGFLYETPFSFLVAVKSGRHVQRLQLRSEGRKALGGKWKPPLGYRNTEEGAQLWIQLYCI